MIFRRPFRKVRLPAVPVAYPRHMQQDTIAFTGEKDIRPAGASEDGTKEKR